MQRSAQIWHTFTAVAAIVALAMQIPISAADVDGDFDTPAGRVANLFTLFTVLTNLVVVASCLQCAFRPDLRSTLWRTVRVDAVLGIVIVAVVYHTLLAGLDDLQGNEVVVNLLWHTVIPIATVLGWLVFGPRGEIDVRVVAWSVAYPLGWLACTLVRGAVIDWYPYPFVEVSELGYAQVAVNCLGITALFLGLAVVLMGLDRALRRGGAAATLRRAIAGAEHEGDLRMLAETRVTLAEVLLSAGDRATAHDLLVTADRWFSRSGAGDGAALASGLLATLRAEDGDTDTEGALKRSTLLD